MVIEVDGTFGDVFHYSGIETGNPAKLSLLNY
jgi:hypothetical protein